MDTLVAGKQVRFEGSVAVAEGTRAFRFSRPEGFTFRAGQAIDLVLPAAGGEEQRHAFSIVSAPFEPELVVATRMRDSAYKRSLAALPAGAAALVDGPFGNLGWHRDAARAALLVAGGIGITPFVSMLRQACHERASRRITLLYSNRRPEDAAFLAELRRLQERHPGFRLVATMTDMPASRAAWDGPAGMIDAAMAKDALAGLARPIGYVAGPPAMVAFARALLAGIGVDEDDIRSEDFLGY